MTFILVWFDNMEFSETLQRWYAENRRDLPWRNTSDPYKIWISEVILQQTRVAQGLGYYLRFIEQFPTLAHLANAPIDKVMKVWQGLGYYTRARNLHQSAKTLLAEYQGALPRTYHELLKIRGIGAYSAGAIASFAYREVIPAIDGNVYRVLSRVFGVFHSAATASGKREFYDIAMELIDQKRPDVFNQALLDFGALVCTPKKPGCDGCPFNVYCYAFRNNVVDKLPIMGKKLVPKDRFFNYLVVVHSGRVFMHRREEEDIWHSLYQFPLIETDANIEVGDLLETERWKELLMDCRVTAMQVYKPAKHLLSHQTIYTMFVLVEVDKPSYFLLNNYLPIPLSDIGDVSVPRVIDLYLAAEPLEKYRTSYDGQSTLQP